MRIGLSLKEGVRRERQHRDRDEEQPHPVASQDESRTSLGDVIDFSGLHRKEEDEQ